MKIFGVGAPSGIATIALGIILSAVPVDMAENELLWAPWRPADIQLAIIVNKANPLDNLTTQQLRRIFRGEQTFWSNGRRITVVMRDPEQPERAAVLRFIYRMTEDEYSRYILHSTFTGEVSAAPRTVSTSAAMRKFVSYVPGAIGYLRADEMDDTVKAIQVDGCSLGDECYRMKIHVK